MADTQAHHLERAQARLDAVIEIFVRNRVGVGQTFTAEQLRRHVEAYVPSSAPGSADRVLRALRQQGRINYECTSRRESTYRVLAIERQGRLL